MKRLRLGLILPIIVLLPLFLTAQLNSAGSSTPNQNATTSGASQAAGAMAPSSALKITSPKSGAKVGSSAVTVEYELTNQGVTAASSPNYRIQLDSRDPVDTTSNSYSFSGLKPGKHTVSVQVVDANGTPIMGAQSQVQFTTANQMPAGSKQGPTGTGSAGTATQPGSRTMQQGQQPQGSQAAPQSPQAELLPPSIHKANLPLPGQSDELPSAGGELPLLSMVGFGVLVGGVISAMRTRK